MGALVVGELSAGRKLEQRAVPVFEEGRVRVGNLPRRFRPEVAATRLDLSRVLVLVQAPARDVELVRSLGFWCRRRRSPSANASCSETDCASNVRFGAGPSQRSEPTFDKYSRVLGRLVIRRSQRSARMSRRAPSDHRDICQWVGAACSRGHAPCRPCRCRPRAGTRWRPAPSAGSGSSSRPARPSCSDRPLRPSGGLRRRWRRRRLLDKDVSACNPQIVASACQ